eukprot:CAMPEP_0202430198 /NCGR_PEP_ID=MMETSP1345-20130828/3713_1 /ASSEMBLY_ACC=CAM_ASM_000843 /TAXON_ID=342563 /ORGANISM="Fabrea Fabrea salina" /LENGTH=1238 /DNA_ID=CAMNT_0049041617 /DNA_START=37 /DNA_END=3750 /DNA_ORIENTATION=-
MEKLSKHFDQSSFLGDLMMKWAFTYAKYYGENKPHSSNLVAVPQRTRYYDGLSKLQENWDKEVSKKDPKFLRALFRTFRAEYFKYVVPEIVSLSLLLVQATMIMLIIDFMKSNDAEAYLGVIYCVTFGVSALITILFENYSLYQVLLLVSKVKNLVAMLVFSEMLEFSVPALNEGDVSGKVFNTISSDMELLDLLVDSIAIWGIPILVIAGSIEVFLIFGVAGVLGIVLSVLHLPLITLLNKLEMSTRLNLTRYSDSRVKLTTNLIEGIRVVKLFGWEPPFLKFIFRERSKEISGLRKNANVTVSMEVMYLGGIGLIIFATLSTHVLLGNELDSGPTFATISILALVHLVVIFVSESGIRSLFMLAAACERITEVLLTQKVTQKNLQGPGSICCEDASFAWEEPSEDQTLLLQEETKHTLTGLNFKVQQGEVVGVVGPVGCGKSALINALLQEIPLREGRMSICNSVAVATEKPWLVSGSIKDNILMGKPYNHKLYWESIRCCALEKDIELLGDKDETLVGDRGVTLSGGQKARINLARAVYADKQIVLLDDPLSAVDSEVGKHIFQQCIKGTLSGKTVVLATHQLGFLSEVDKVLVLLEGKQMFYGKYQELKQREDLETYLGELLSLDSNSVTKEEPQTCKGFAAESLEIEEEETAQGAIPFKTYLEYLRYGFYSVIVILVVVLVVLASQSVLVGVYFWMGEWITADDQTESFYYEVFGVIVVVLYLMCILRLGSVYNGILTSNKNLHNQAIESLSRTHCSFYDMNPTGRILNRFSKDTSIADEPLAISYLNAVNTSTIMLGNIVTIVIIFPPNLAICVLWGVLMFFVIKTFFPLSKEFRRLELVTRSPLITHFAAALNGLVTIRCLGLQTYFKNLVQEDAAQNFRAYFCYQTMLRPIQLYAELFASFIIVANVAFLVGLRDFVSPELAGISISLTISAMGIASIWAKSLVETDNYMASPQRLIEYTELPSEGNYQSESKFEINYGKIEFQNVSMKYRENFPLSLKEVSFTIPPGAKVGVVGRTGSGKSSLLQVLFRLCSPCGGRIFLDNQDYMLAGLHQLRTQMSVIPQEPFLFKASVRDNLDPLHEHSCEEIQRVLADLKLEFLVPLLEQELEDLSSKLSAGQKQLVCLGRAVLKHNKVVFMDEATANVDFETDKLIHKKIEEKFQGVTVVVIAHRLRSVVGSDLIAVMEEGTCKEFAPPLDLVNKPGSLFSTMISHCGSQESQLLLSSDGRRHL